MLQPETIVKARKVWTSPLTGNAVVILRDKIITLSRKIGGGIGELDKIITLSKRIVVDVGDLDIFRDEDISYASRLSDAGVPTEFHLHPGCPHAFEVLAYGADVSSRTLSDRIRRLHTL